MSVSDSHSDVPATSGNDDVIFYDAPKKYSPSRPAYSPGLSGNGRKARPSAGRLVLRILAFVLGGLLIVSGVTSIVIFSFFNRINYEAGPDKTQPGAGAIVDPGKSLYQGNLLNDKQILNILLIGADTRKNQVRGNSDTMMLMSIDNRHKKLKLLSFMRDTYCTIPGYDSNKLNASFTIGGADLTIRTIQTNYGIEIDRYAVVDFESFSSIIDVLGGLDIELSEEEVDYIDWQCWKNHQVNTRHELDAENRIYHPNTKGDYITLVHLNGRQALWHARNRGEEGICSGDDYVRTQRQRAVIGNIVDRLKASDFSTVVSILYEIGPLITTNLKTTEITSLASNVTKYLKYDLVSQSAPDRASMGVDYFFSDNVYPIYIDGYQQSCIIITDWFDFRKKVANFVFGDENPLKVS